MKDDDHKRFVYKVKSALSASQLCAGLPVEFIQFFKYVKGLKWDDHLNYDYLRGLFRGCFYRLGFSNDFDFDWIRLTVLLF
jgi:hypothetical protein